MGLFLEVDELAGELVVLAQQWAGQADYFRHICRDAAPRVAGLVSSLGDPGSW